MAAIKYLSVPSTSDGDRLAGVEGRIVALGGAGTNTSTVEIKSGQGTGGPVILHDAWGLSGLALGGVIPARFHQRPFRDGINIDITAASGTPSIVIGYVEGGAAEPLGVELDAMKFITITTTGAVLDGVEGYITSLGGTGAGGAAYVVKDTQAGTGTLLQGAYSATQLPDLAGWIPPRLLPFTDGFNVTTFTGTTLVIGYIEAKTTDPGQL